METKGASLWWCGLLVALSLTSTGCLEAVVGEIGACKYGEKLYDVGDQFASQDGCNTCSCSTEGEVSCTEKACFGDGALAPNDAGVAPVDSGLVKPPTMDPTPPVDASAGSGLCPWQGKMLPAGETFLDDCRKCWCAPEGKVQCDPIACSGDCSYDGRNYKVGESVPRSKCESCICEMGGSINCKPVSGSCVEPGSCTYEGTQRKPGEWFAAADGCNKCNCQMDGKVVCSTDTCMGPTCTLNGELHKFGEVFYDELRCNSCSCTMDGGVACTARACDEQSACKLGDAQFASGTSITCEDGCNSCLCTNGTWSSTDRACGVPAKIEICDGNTTEMLKANVVYLSGDRLLIDANFVGCEGSAPNVKLCWDGSFLESSPVQAQLKISTGAASSCTSWVTQQALFDLTPLRDAYRMAYQSQEGRIVLRLFSSSPIYGF